MKLGLGLYKHQLDREHFQFAKQCGCTHLVIHLVDYFRSSRSNRPGDQPVGDDTGWGLAGDPGRLWTFEEIAAVKKEISAAGLELAAIENFDPAHWHGFLKKLGGKPAIPVLIGVWPLNSYKQALRLNNEVPGIMIPDALLKSMEAAGASARDRGFDVAREMMAWARTEIAGVYLIPPFKRYEEILEIL